MLTIYRRHKKECPRRRKQENREEVGMDLFLRVVDGREKCSCPFWADGFFGGQEVRRSLKTRNQQKAVEAVRGWKIALDESKSDNQPVTIQQAGNSFLADVKSRQLAECTAYKYRLLFKQLEAFAKKHGLRFVEELDLARLGQFRSEWKDGPRSSLKKLERLRAFLRFCECREWIKKNPASKLKAPKVHDRPTLPYTQAEIVKILAAFGEYEKGAGIANAQRLRAFVLVLRYSGMRIGDTVKLSIQESPATSCFYTHKRPA